MRRASLIFVAALAGCSALEAQRPVGNALTVPAGWKEFPVPFRVAANPLIGMWTNEKDTKGVGTGSFITLIRLPSGNTKTTVDEIMTSSGSKDAQVLERKDLTLCNGAKGVQTRMKATQSTNGSQPRQLEMEVVAGQGKGEVLLAIYARPDGTPADPAALNAVQHLCPIEASKMQ